ncbi:MAG: DUF3883 domain-containing protein, partial [Bacteroidetes bacterium]|nr:DUF3883 domain-containing protein [Bacteroidota bacterium]
NNETKQVIPFQASGKPNVFLPTKEHSKYLTVKNNIAKNKEARKFLEDLGLTTPDLFAEINEFVLPKLKEENTYPEYFQDIKKILDAFQSQNQEKRKRLIQDLKDCPFILAYNPTTGETKHLKYSSIYFSNELLNTYFENSTEVFYVAEEQYSLNQTGHTLLVNLLTEIGVKSTLWRVEFDPKFDWQEKSKLRNGNSCTYDIHCKDFKLDGIDEFLNSEITLQKSVALWKLLVNAIFKIENSYHQRKFFQGEYCYKFYSEYTINFDAYFLKKLKNSEWLIIDDTKYKPNDISYTSLPEIYKENGGELHLLAEVLGFKPDEIKAIEEKTGGKFLSKEEAKEWEEFQKLKSEQSNNTKDDTQQQIEEEKFEPDLKPTEVEIKSRELETADINIAFNTNQGNITLDRTEQDINDNYNNTSDGQTTKEEKPTVSQNVLNDIGAWGQDYAFRDLSNEFSENEDTEIVDLNTKGLKGVGADFKVIKGDEIIRIIEVKSTTEKFGQTLSISGTQWEVARNYFKLNDGDKYWIYCVFNAGKENAEIVKIKNPIQKWKEGKLLAHPINFVIK